MVAQNILLDLVGQGWSIAVRSQLIRLRPAADGPSKDVIRQRHLIERDAQLREKSVAEFIQNMERRTLTSKGWHSIYSVMRDGQELATALKQMSRPAISPTEISCVINPYLQFVEPGVRCTETGLLISDIWRYFRHTWVTSYKSVPGRSLSILIRDRAVPGHPIIGIAALSSSVVQQSVRDRWIGWDAKTIVHRLEEHKVDRQFVGKLLKHLDRRVSEIYTADLIRRRIIQRRDIHHPSDAAISRLRAEAKKAMALHRKYPEASVHKRSSKHPAWKQMAKMHLFRAKRCRELASLLQIRQTISDSRIHDARGNKLAAVLKSSGVRNSLAQIVRFLKAENVGVHMMDIAVCGAVAPYNALLGGKLVCTLLCSPEVVKHYKRKYNGQTSIIASGIRGKQVRKVPNLVLLCTTSLYGNGSSQYNRLKIPIGDSVLAYEELGSSEGSGHFISARKQFG